MSEPDRKRRSRIRWVTLGEAVAIAAVVISGLTLYANWQDRQEDRANKVAESTRTGRPAPFHLRAVVAAEGGRLTLSPLADAQSIQTQTIRFPPALGLAPVVTNGDPRIDAGWFASSLKAARRKRELPDATAGDARLPVMIATDYLASDGVRTARGYYDVGYTLEDRFLRGAQLKLGGMAFVAAAPPGDAAVDRRLSTLWASR